MPANTQPIHILTPKYATARIDAANTARDGSGTLVAIFTAGSFGSRVDTVTFVNSQATPGVSALKVCRVYVSNTSGTNHRLRSEILLPTLTPSNTVIGSIAVITFTNGMVLESGQVVSVSQSLCATAADNTDVFLQAGNY